MVYLFGKKTIFLVILFGAQASSYSMQLLRAVVRAEVRKSVCSQQALRNPTLHKTAHTQLGSRLLCSSRNSSVSEESWLAGQEELLKKAEIHAQEAVKLISVVRDNVGERLHAEKPEPELFKIQNKERRAYLALDSMHMWESSAEQWARICEKAVIDLEHKYAGDTTDAARTALERAHKDACQAGINLRNAQEGVKQAKQELDGVREQLKIMQAEHKQSN